MLAAPRRRGLRGYRCGSQPHLADFSRAPPSGRSCASWRGMPRFVGRRRLSEARVASDLRRQFVKEAGDRGSDASGEVSIAGFRGVLESGLGVVDLADNFVFFGREFDANHKMGVSGTGLGEPENRERVIIPF